MNKTVLIVLFLTTCSISLSACNDSSLGSGINTKVYKYSGALQCQPDSAIPADEMILELTGAGIDVLCTQTGNDGSAHPAVCGANTGEINIYLIRTVNLPDAENLGFTSVLALPDYQDATCKN